MSGVDTYVAPFVATELEKFAGQFRSLADTNSEVADGLLVAATALSLRASDLRALVAEKRQQQVETLGVLMERDRRQHGTYPGAPDGTELS